MFADNQTENPTSTPVTSDYMTQGDPDASPSASNEFRSAPHNKFLNTNNIFVKDGSDRQIHQILN